MASKPTPKAEFEQVSPTAYRVSVAVPSERFQRKLDAKYAELAKGAEIPGFRPGKAPRNILNRHFGRERILQETAEEMIQETIWPLIKQRELTLVGSPRVDPEEWHAGEEFRYVAAFEVVPPVPEVDYDALEVKLPKREVTDETVEEELRRLSLRLGTHTDITDRPVQDADFLVVDLEGEVPDVEVERPDGEGSWGLREEAMEVEVGRGKAIEGLEDALRGMELEEIREFDLVLPDDFPDPRVRGKTMKTKARVKAIRVIEPLELSDDAVKERFGEQEIETLDDLKERIRTELQGSHSNMDERATVEQIEAYLLASFDFPLPEGLVRSEFADVLDRSLAALKERGADIEDLMRPENETGRKMRKRARFRAERITRIDLIMREIARREAIGVSHEEVTNYIMMLGYRQGLKDRDLKVLLRDAHFLESTRQDILRKKVTHFLLDKVRAERVSPEEFRDIMEREREEREGLETSFVESAEDPLLTINEDYLPSVEPAKREEVAADTDDEATAAGESGEDVEES